MIFPCPRLERIERRSFRWRKKNFRNENYVIFLLGLRILAGAATAGAEEPPTPTTGSISGRFFKHGQPHRVQVNLHRADGAFLRSLKASQTGDWVFDSLRLGDYFLITQPSRDMPVQWVTRTIQLSAGKENIVLPGLDCYAAAPISPAAEENYHRQILQEDRPLIFRWSRHSDAAQYEITIEGLENGRQWKSGQLRRPLWRFSGGRVSGRSPMLRAYRWRLHIFPADSLWHGHSMGRMFYTLGYGRQNRLDGESVYLQLPRWYIRFAGSFQMLQILDQAYDAHEGLTGVKPFEGRKFGVLFDPQINFAHSGNPLHVGADFWKFYRPPWDTIFHEMGHDFQTGSSRALTSAIVHQKTGLPFYHNFVEGLATLAVFYVSERVENRLMAGRSADALAALRKVSLETEQRCRRAWNIYLESAKPFEELDPDATDGMLLALKDEFGWGMYERFFRLFNSGPEAEALCLQAGTHEERIALVAAALSVAAGRDLREKFLAWRFPLSTSGYVRFMTAWEQIRRSSPLRVTAVSHTV